VVETVIADLKSKACRNYKLHGIHCCYRPAASYKKSPGSNNLNGGIKEAQAANQGDDSILLGLAEHKLNSADNITLTAREYLGIRSKPVIRVSQCDGQVLNLLTVLECLQSARFLVGKSGQVIGRVKPKETMRQSI
jgi:hypothetical protein